MASDEIDKDMVLGAGGGVGDSYTNSDAAVGELLLPNINTDDDPALLGLDIDMSATATEMIADWDSLGEEPIGYSYDVTVRADSNSRTHSTTGGVLGHLNGDIFDAESTVEVTRMDSRDRADDRSGVDGVERAADASCEDEVAEDPLDGKGECDPVCDDSHIQHIGGNNENHSSNVGELGNLDSTQYVPGVKDKEDSADGLTNSTGGGDGVQGLMIQGTHKLTGEIHGEASCGASSTELLSINNRTPSKIMSTVSKQRILANQITRSDEPRNSIQPDYSLFSQASSTELLSINNRTPSKIMSLVSKQRILANQITRSNEPRNSIQPDHQRVPKLPPPGPGWTARFVPGVDQNRWHWISPTRKLEFTRRPQARLFEELRNKYGADEVVALEKYKLKMKKKPTFITPQSSTTISISLSRHSKERRACGHVTIKRPCRSSIRAPTLIKPNQESNQLATSPQKMWNRPPPGHGWRTKYDEKSQTHHWLSPTRSIEFKRYTVACEFEKLRSKYGSDELRAWEEYRKKKFGVDMRVVTPYRYDLPASESAVKNVNKRARRWGTAKSTKPMASDRNDGGNGNKRRSDDTHDWGRANRKRSRQASQGESALTMRKPCSSQPNREATRACNAHPSPRPKARSEPPGPGWNYKYVKEKNRYSYYWISPTRCIVFRRHKQACEFEELRSKYGSDEVRAWEEYRKMKFGQDTWVVSACLYDGGGNKRRADDKHDRGRVSPERSRQAPKGAAALTTKRSFAAGSHRDTVRAVNTPQKPGTDPPGPGWKSRYVEETKGNFAHHWISPTRCIEFRRYKQACEFEDLRFEYGSDEVRAWNEYRKMKLGDDVRVVTPHRYDENTSNKRTASDRHDQGLVKVRSRCQVPSGEAVLTTRRNIKQALIAPLQPRADPPGPGWKSRYVEESKNKFVNHWVSPTRNIEFKRRKQACKFEGLRSEYGYDEVRAWTEYRKSTVGTRTSYVVNPLLYDGGVSNKRRADDKHDQGHVTSKRQRRVPSAKGAVALTTMRSSASEPYQETALACSTPRKAGVDSPGPGGKSKYTQSDDVDIGSCNECDDGGATSTVTLDRASIIASLRPNTNTEGLSDYELLRLQKIQRNEAKLASLGLCGITSKNHSHNSGSSGIGGNGTNEGSGKINESYKDIVDSEAYLPFSPPPVPRYPSKPRQFLHPTTQTDNRISTLNDNEDVAWEEYQNLKPDLVTPNDNAIATKSNSSSRWREMESDDVDVDSCYICDDGGDLILCDYCPKAFHLNCHIPRLFRIPQGDWRCCECSASMYKKRHRCGECQACLRPDCGVCSACKGKKKFGGDGTHGKACKDRDCKNMRFAPPERMSNNGTCPFNSRKKNVELIGNSRSAFKSVAESSSNRMSNNSLNLLDCPFSTSFEPSPDNGLNSREIEIMRLKPSNKRCFFSEIFPGKTLRVRSKLDDGNPEKTVTFDGMKYTLASAKLVKGNGGRMSYMKSKEIEHLYVRSTCLQKMLESICSFQLMETTKVVARLGHFQSDARSIYYIDRVNIKGIQEVGHVGCGFCPDYFFEKWGVGGCDAIQVRIACPAIGLAKGMLLKKSNISHIQLPKSMIKAPFSEAWETNNYAAVIIKNEFPSDENKQFGRFLDPYAADPCKSWAEKGRKPLSDMYQRMLVGFGVNRADVNEYTRTAKNHEKLKHAHLKGVIDPTGKLPKNQVFISGYTTNVNKERVLFGKAHPKVFLSRSPCLEPTDAKLLNVVGSKPREMSTDDWNMLCSYGYGSVIFPQSRSDPLATIIADGDLDGDDYFVLWDERIIHHLMNSKDKLTSKSRKLLNTLELPKRVKQSVKKDANYSPSPDDEWLSKAQDLMLDFPTQLKASQLVGKFYGLCNKASIREDGSIDLYDEDAIAYARCHGCSETWR